MIYPLRIGVIGGGFDSAVGACHIAAIRMDGAYSIGPCIFSQFEENNRISHERYGLPWHGHPKSFGDWLDDNRESFDLVAILSPSTSHADHIKEVALRKISFITEKPVGCSLAEIKDIQSALTGVGEVQARFVHNYSGYPMFRELVHRLSKGRIGAVYHVRIAMPSDGFARENISGKPQKWRQTDSEVPMIMLDLGTHMYHLVRMAIGYSKSHVIARMHKMVNSFHVFDNIEIWEERTDGIRVSYWMSKAHLGVKNGLEIEVYGRNGAYIWRQMDPDHLIEIDTESNRTVINRASISSVAARRDRFKAGHPTGFVEAFANFYSDLAEDILLAEEGVEGNPWICSIQEAFDGIMFLEAATRSHHLGKWVEV